MVILDNECREYREGYNACNAGKHWLSCPYGCSAYNGELNRLWESGYQQCQLEWDSPNCKEPKSWTEQELRDSFSIRDQEPTF